jgi:hypothetical protein
VDESDEPRFGYEMASRATAYRCWRGHGDVGLLDTRTPPGWKPLCAPLVSGLPRESYSSLARSVRKILEVWPLSAQHGPVTVSTEVMRSTTAVRPSTDVREARRNRRRCWSDGPFRLIKGGGAADLIADQRWIQLVEPKKQEPAFPLLRGHMVGLGGLEPPASSLSAKYREPLCEPPFAQVALDRRGRS